MSSFKGKIISKILKVKFINSFSLRVAIWLHNFSYRFISRLAVLENNGFHPKHRITNYHQFFVDNVNLNDVVLDIGCGFGALTFDLAQKANKVIGIDLSKENIKIAKEKFWAPNIEYMVGDATRDLPNQKSDIIVLSNVLEHIEDRVQFLREIKKLARKFLIRVPMITRDWLSVYKKEKGFEYRLDRAHYIEYTLEVFQEELQKASLGLDKFSIQFGEIWAVVK